MVRTTPNFEHFVKNKTNKQTPQQTNKHTQTHKQKTKTKTKQKQNKNKNNSNNNNIFDKALTI